MRSDNFFISNLKHNDLVGAPLAGISNLPFRKIVRKFTDGLVYSEMISVEGLSRKGADSLEYLDRYDGETNLVYQLFGGKPKTFEEAIKVVEDRCIVEAYDINMGCPVKKVIKAGGGTSLLNDLDRLKDIVTAVRKSTSKPFSIKIRIGLDDKQLVYKEILKIAEGEGVDALVIHARTKQDMFSGRVRLDILSEIKSISTIPIIGNGGVVDSESYDAMKVTGVDGVMIGRAMMRSPWIFHAIKNNLATDYMPKSQIADILSEINSHMLAHSAGDSGKLNHYKNILIKFAVWFSKGMRDAVEFRINLYKATTTNDVLYMIDNFYNSYSESHLLV